MSTLLIPAIAPLVLAWTAGRYDWISLPPAVWELLPAILMGVTALLAWRFHRRRLAWAAIVLLVADQVLRRGAPGLATDGATPWPALVATSVTALTPLNLALLCLVSEGRLARHRGALMPTLLALQGAAVLVACASDAPAATMLLTRRWLAALPAEPWGLAQTALLPHLVAIAAISARFLYRRTAVEAGLLGAAVASMLAAGSTLGGTAYLTYLGAAGLVLLLSLVETSYRLAFRDDLTGLSGRRAFNEALRGLTGHYTVAMVDVDHFKRFNDRFGHEAGDQVLRMVAARLEDVSGGGRTFRHGGEEFAVIFDGRAVEEALPHLEALRRTIADSPFSLRGWNRPRKKPKTPPKRRGRRRSARITVSIGAAERSDRAPRPDDVVRLADKRLYKAKRAGRNRVAA